MVEKTEYKYETLPDPKAEPHRWALETAKDIDSTLCEHAREVKEKFGIENIRYLDAQKARIDLIKAVMEM
ncbi:MAG: hypothetical protein PHN90_11485 [Methanothrix sp.]|jgi:hypothetical protein|nr:hypothetical protein [Methanothrix sp.]